MALNLVQGSVSLLYKIAITGVTRNRSLASWSMKVASCSYSTGQGSGAVKDSDTAKSVFISQSDDIFTNLALEDWLYRNFDFTKHHILLLWKNSPAVVIGRHQNPWLEANTAILSEHGIEIARRNSGGGTVYHDHGNLNLTFFTPREHYNRKNNLQLICRALLREWGLKTEISPREDIVINGSYKVSFISNILMWISLLVYSVGWNVQFNYKVQACNFIEVKMSFEVTVAFVGVLALLAQSVG